MDYSVHTENTLAQLIIKMVHIKNKQSSFKTIKDCYPFINRRMNNASLIWTYRNNSSFLMCLGQQHSYPVRTVHKCGLRVTVRSQSIKHHSKKSQHFLCWDPEPPDDIRTGNETNTLHSKQRYAKMSPNACSVSSLLSQVRNLLPWCQLLSTVTMYHWYLTRHWRTPVEKLKPLFVKDLFFSLTTC